MFSCKIKITFLKIQHLKEILPKKLLTKKYLVIYSEEKKIHQNKNADYSPAFKDLVELFIIFFSPALFSFFHIA